MKNLILIVVLLSSTSYAKTQYRYVPKTNKNFFSLMLGVGPTGLTYIKDSDSYEYRSEFGQKTTVQKGYSGAVQKKYGPVYGAHYTRMFNKNFGGNLGFMSNSSAFAGITIGW